MGNQIFCCSRCKQSSPYDKEAQQALFKGTPDYNPPNVTTLSTSENTKFTKTFSELHRNFSPQCPPPKFLKRLDKCLKEKRITAHDFFLMCDKNHHKSLSFDEFLDGLEGIHFVVTQMERTKLWEWIDEQLDGSITFKELTCALKERNSVTSPKKAIDVWAEDN